MNTNPTRKLWLAATALFAGLVSVSASTPHDSPRLFGANLSGGDFHNKNIGYPGPFGTDYFYPSNNHMDWAKSQGFNLVRVPFRWERVQWSLNGALTTQDITAIDAALDRAEARGLRVVLDMHNYAGRVIGVADDKPNQIAYKFGAPELPASAYADVWRQLAEHFKNRACIWGYDIMNEPSGISHEVWIAYAQAAINAIREVDTTHAIILEGTYSANAVRWPDEGAYLLTSVTDPSNNIIYSAHCYNDRDGSGTWSNGGTMQAELVGQPNNPDLAAAQMSGVRRVQIFTDWCVANNVRGLIGEYGCPSAVDPINWKISLVNMLDYIRDNTNGLVSATQWGGGGFGSSYKISMGGRRDSSEPLFMDPVRTYSNNMETNWWFPFTVYGNSLVVTQYGDYSFGYSFPTANCTVTTNDTSSFYGTSGSSIGFTYTAPSGVFPGGGVHIRGPLIAGNMGGMDLRKNRDASHVLSFYAKATPGATMNVTLATCTSDSTGLDTGSETHVGSAFNVGTIAPLNATWQRYEIPLSSMLNASLNGDQPIQRIKFNFGPSDDATYQVNIDQISIQTRSTNTAPALTVDTSTDGSSFAAGQSVTLVATASDTDAGDSIDYVEFNADGRIVGIDDTAPYQYTTSFATAGTYNVTAVAYDSHGVPGRSTTKALTITAAVEVIVDNTAAEYTGTWGTSTTKPNRYNTDYRYKSSGTGANKMRWRPTIPSAGTYQVYYWLPDGGTDRATNAPFTVYFNGGSQTYLVNEQPIPGGQWVLLGSHTFAVGTAGYVELADNGNNNFVIGDAIRFYKP